MLKLRALLRNLKERFTPPRRLLRLESDTPPARMPKRDLVLLLEGGDEWSVAMKCPCGCGDTVELPLIAEAHPRWRLDLNKRGQPTLNPSVWKKDGCRSHYFVRHGKVVWV